MKKVERELISENERTELLKDMLDNLATYDQEDFYQEHNYKIIIEVRELKKQIKDINLKFEVPAKSMKELHQILVQ